MGSSHQWYILGLSLGNLLEVNSLADYLKALTTLLQEYESWSASGRATVVGLGMC
jgi:hypothetical protein